MIKPTLPQWLHGTDLLIMGIIHFCALYWYLERAVFIDNSFYVFHLVRDEAFSVNHLRLGSIFAQIPAVLAVKLGAGLTLVSLFFSWGFALYYSVISVLLLRWNQRPLFYLMLLSQLLVSMYAYFWVASELPMAIAFSVMIVGIIRAKKQGCFSENTATTLLLPAYFLAVFFHPLNGFVLAGLLLVIMSTDGCDWKYYGSYLLSFVFIWILRQIFITTPYETQAAQGLMDIHSLIQQFWSLPATLDMPSHLAWVWPLWVMIYLWIWLWFLKQKNYLTPVLITFLVAVMVIMINVNFSSGGTHFYMENLYHVPGFFLACGWMLGPGLHLSFSSLKWVMGILLILFMIRIWTAGEFYKARLNVYRHLIKETQMKHASGAKWLMAETELPMDTLLMSWCAAYEIWQLSTMEGKQSKAIVVEEVRGQLDWIKGDRKKFHTRFENAEISSLNPRYFNMDTLSGYLRWPPEKE